MVLSLLLPYKYADALAGADTQAFGNIFAGQANNEREIKHFIVVRFKLMYSV